MNRLTRITAILIQLQSKSIVTAKEMAERFEVSLRTIYRDIKTLQDAGVPIGSENGVGYFIVDGYSLPPIMITEEEANALLVSEKFILSQGDKSLIKDFNSVLIKLKSVLRSFEKRSLSILEDRVYSSFDRNIFDSDSLSLIQKAITNANVLKIVYHSIYKDEITTREVGPLGLYFTQRAWILIAYCRLRENTREFRLDRIEGVIITREKFNFKENFNLKNYFEEILKHS